MHKTQQHTHSPDFRFSLRWLLAATAALSIVLALVVEVSSWWVSAALTRQVDEGMTRLEVVQVLGEPHRIQGAPPKDLWLYNDWGCSDMFKIAFNDEEKVEWATF